MAQSSTAYNETQIQDLLDSMVVRPEWQSRIDRTVKKIAANKKIYQEIADEFGNGIPWLFIGLLHDRESGCDFTTHLHNGDPLVRRTRQEPAGRPKKGTPPFSFKESALDALSIEGFGKITDWSMCRMVDAAERYNGLGYRKMGELSPYVWSGTNHYTKGKFIRDHKYDPNAVDEQIGAAPILIALAAWDTPYTKQELKEGLPSYLLTSVSTKATGLITGLGITFMQMFDWVNTTVKDHTGAILLGVVGSMLVILWSIDALKQRENEQGKVILKKDM